MFCKIFFPPFPEKTFFISLLSQAACVHADYAYDKFMNRLEEAYDFPKCLNISSENLATPVRMAFQPPVSPILAFTEDDAHLSSSIDPAHQNLDFPNDDDNKENIFPVA